MNMNAAMKMDERMNSTSRVILIRSHYPCSHAFRARGEPNVNFRRGARVYCHQLQNGGKNGVWRGAVSVSSHFVLDSEGQSVTVFCIGLVSVHCVQWREVNGNMFQMQYYITIQYRMFR